MPSSAASAEVLRLGLRTTRQAMGDPAGADVHHRAVGFADHLQKIWVSCSGTALDIDDLSQIRRLVAGALHSNAITHLHVKNSGRMGLTQGPSGWYRRTIDGLTDSADLVKQEARKSMTLATELLTHAIAELQTTVDSQFVKEQHHRWRDSSVKLSRLRGIRKELLAELDQA